MNFKEELTKYIDIINNELTKYLKKEDCPEHILNESKGYSLMAGGKRLRPILIIASYNLFKDDIEKINKIDVSDIYINNATIPISKYRRKQLKARLIEVLGDKLC